MRTRALLGVALIAVLLSGCAPSDNRATTTPAERPSLSNQAGSVWSAYFEVYTAALAGDDVKVSDLQPYLTSGEYDFISKRITEFRDGGFRVQGEVSSRSFTLASSTAGDKVIYALVCVDNGVSKILDSEGEDVTPDSRPQTSTLRLAFRTSRGKLLLDGDETWSKSSVC